MCVSASQAASEGEPLEKYSEWREASKCKKTGDVRSAVVNVVALHAISTCTVLMTLQVAAVFEYAISHEHVCDSKLAQYCVLSGVDSKHESTLLLPLSSCMDTSLQALGTSCQLPMVCLTHFML